MNNIILVFYVKVNYEEGLASQLDETIDALRTGMEHVDGVQYFVVPIEHGDNRIECINPKLVDETAYEKARKLLEEQSQLLQDIIEKQRK